MHTFFLKKYLTFTFGCEIFPSCIDQNLFIRDLIDVVSEMGHDRNTLVSEPGTFYTIIHPKTEPKVTEYNSPTDTRLPSKIWEKTSSPNNKSTAVGEANNGSTRAKYVYLSATIRETGWQGIT